MRRRRCGTAFVRGRLVTMHMQTSVTFQYLHALAAQLYRDADEAGPLFIREKMRDAARELDDAANDLAGDAMHAAQRKDK